MDRLGYRQSKYTKKLAETTEDNANLDTGENATTLFSAEDIASGEIHSVKYLDGFRYELDLTITKQKPGQPTDIIHGYMYSKGCPKYNK